MAQSSARVEVYLEIGQKRVFAGAPDWPGWLRSGRDESSALQALLEYGPRYAEVLRASGLEFSPPAEASALVVVERLRGTATTDFGAPDTPPSTDADPVDAAALRRLQRLLEGCWRTFDAAVTTAAGRPLRKGPRGGGRDLDRIVQHLLDGDAAYLSRLGWNANLGETSSPDEALARTRHAILQGLAASVGSRIPSHGPRGGLRWGPRYFVRRVAWHTLDHAWEIQDRLQ